MKTSVTHSQLWLLKLTPEDKVWYLAKWEEPGTLTICFQGLWFPRLSWSEPWDNRAIVGRETWSTSCLWTTEGNQCFHGPLLSRTATDRTEARVLQVHRHKLLTLCTFLMSLMLPGVWEAEPAEGYNQPHWKRWEIIVGKKCKSRRNDQKADRKIWGKKRLWGHWVKSYSIPDAIESPRCF